MGLKLQRFDFRSSTYQRPNQDWVCGKAAQGLPCSSGPNGNGSCRGGFQCSPIQKGDHWSCTRAVSEGGACENGPSPTGQCACAISLCKPKRSLFAKRRFLVRWFMAVTILVMIGLFGLPTSVYESFVSPGPLSKAHTKIENCASCHGDAPTNMAELLVSAVHGDPHEQLQTTCETCHEKEAHFQAHNLPKEKLLTLLNDKQKGIVVDGQAFDASQANMSHIIKDDGKLNCLTCHNDHDGLYANTSDVDMVNCNSCHVNQFDGFDPNHINLAKKEGESGKSIKFQHALHFNKYYASTSAQNPPKACLTCHETGKDFSMPVAGFENTCQTCHKGSLKNQSFAVFGIPGLDMESLTDQNIGIGEWPEDVDAEGIPQFVNLLLAGDEDYTTAINYIVDEDIDLLDLSEEEPETLEHVRTIAWSIKSLYFDIAQNGSVAIQERLEENYGRPYKVKSLLLSSVRLILMPFVCSKAQRSHPLKKS